MKKKYYLLTVVAIGTFSFIAYYFGCAEKLKVSHQQNKVETTQGIVTEQTTNKNVAPLNWETYSNKRLGFSFQYPSTWIKNGKDAEVINLSGDTTAVEINFADNGSKTTLLIEYHFAPKGAELFQYAVSQFESSKSLHTSKSKEIKVSGNRAIETITILSKNGRGNKINPELKLIIVDFLDKQKAGEFQFQFKTPLPDNGEIEKFNQVLSTFTFNN